MEFLTKNGLVLPKRTPGSHKGENGKVLVVAGSEDYPGAAILSSIAVLRSGADLVKVIAPSRVAWAINAYSPDIITKKLKGNFFNNSHLKIVESELRNYDVLLIGNGIGLRKESVDFCKKAVRMTKKLKVIDADAIKSISVDDADNSILTPHLKELEYFFSNSGIAKKRTMEITNEKNVGLKSKLIQETSRKFLEKNNIILLKGRIDTIISGEKILYNKTGNSGMTKGGTGDVLAGLCAGFLSQSKDLLQSAVNAAYINGMIGDILLKKKKGFSYIASDMVEEIQKLEPIS